MPETLLQKLTAAVQYIPVVLVQTIFPQEHGVLSSALLGADPSVIWQARARMHMHVFELEQGVVEEVSVLKYRSPEEYL